MTQSASKIAEGPDTERLKKLEEEIRGESVIIEAKNRELINQRKELEIFRAQASALGGYKFRAAFINIPYQFFNEAMESARGIIPKKEREDLLINRMDQETRKSEKLKQELQVLDQEIAGLPAEAQVQKPAVVPEPSVVSAIPSETELKQNLETLHQKLEAQENLFRQEKVSTKTAVQETKGISTPHSGAIKKSKKLEKELKEIEENLGDLIRKEGKLESEETSILEKRIQHIDRTIKKVHSKVMSQDLLTEKERMEARLGQLESRKDFLSKELQRFQTTADAANPRS